MEGLQKTISSHLQYAREMEKQIASHPDFELLAPVPLNTLCFRFAPGKTTEEEKNRLNEKLLANLNSTGKLYMTHTRLNEKYTLRMVIGQTRVDARHVKAAWELILKEASLLQA